jgi:phospholipid transport system substrate-binding protein
MRKSFSMILAGALAAGALAGGIVLASAPAAAQSADPAAATVDELDNGLLAIMHAVAGAGQGGRERQIAPVVDRAFDLPLMTRLSVGPAWLTTSPHDQAGLVAAFRTMTIAQYAHNFDGYSGQHFTVTPQVETRGLDKLVRSTLASPGADPEALNYRLRENGGQWKIIDVYYRNAISQLATRRSDFATVLAKGGAPALIAHLNQLAASPR